MFETVDVVAKKVNLVATYEEIFHVPDEKCMTVCFADCGLLDKKRALDGFDEGVFRRYFHDALGLLGLTEDAYLANDSFMYRINVVEAFEDAIANKAVCVEKGGVCMDNQFNVEVSVSIDGSHGDPLEIVLTGDNLEKLQKDIMPTVLRRCAEGGYTSGEVYIAATYTKDGEYFDHDEEWFDLDELSTWICSYKDVLMALDDDEVDNLTYVLVPTAWLKGTLREEGVTDFNEWLNEYTADSTVDIAWLAMKENVILACDGEKVAAAIRVPVGEYPRTPLEAALEDAMSRSVETKIAEAGGRDGRGMDEIVKE